MDPSIVSLGYAIRKLDEEKILAAGTIKSPSSNNDTYEYQVRALAMAHTVINTAVSLIKALPDGGLHVLTEMPNNWQTQKGNDSKNSESVQKLYWFVGAMLGAMSTHSACGTLHGVYPNEWKGATPKTVMVKRALAYQSQIMTYSSHDAAEAVLLSKWSWDHRSPQAKICEGGHILLVMGPQRLFTHYTDIMDIP